MKSPVITRSSVVLCLLTMWFGYWIAHQKGPVSETQAPPVAHGIPFASTLEASDPPPTDIDRKFRDRNRGWIRGIFADEWSDIAKQAEAADVDRDGNVVPNKKVASNGDGKQGIVALGVMTVISIIVKKVVMAIFWMIVIAQVKAYVVPIALSIVGFVVLLMILCFASGRAGARSMRK